MPKEKKTYSRVQYKLLDLDKEILDAFVPLYNFGITSVKPLNPFHLKHSSDEEPYDYDTESEDDISFSSKTDSEQDETPPRNEMEELEKEVHEAERRDIVLPRVNDYTLLEEHVWREEYNEGQIYHDRARDKWFKDEECIAAALGASLCAYSLWTFPQLCLKHGGIAFCIAYLVVTILFSAPIIYLELLVGQFRQKGTLHCWVFFPIFKGLGFVMLINTFFDVIVNTTILSYYGFYMFESLRFDFHWANCSREWTTTNCVDFNSSVMDLGLNELSRSPAFEYFRARVLRLWKSMFADEVLKTHPILDGAIFGDINILHNFTKASNGTEKYDIDDIGVPSLDLAIICFLFVASAYTILQYRIRSLGCASFFLLFLGYILLGIALVNSWIQPYGKPGSMAFLNVKDGKHFFNTKTWVAAIKHCFLSCGLGTGMYFTIGSNQRFDNRRIKIVAFAAAFGSWITHSVLGLIMAIYWYGTQTYNNTGSFSKSYFGNDSVFEIFPTLIADHSVQDLIQYYSFCFYGSLVCFSCARSYVGIYMIETAFKDSYKHLFDSLRIYYDNSEAGNVHRWERYRCSFNDYTTVAKLLQIIIGLAFTIIITCLTRGGIYIVLFIHNYSFEISRCLALLSEIFALNIMWGTRNIDDAVQSMTGIQSTVLYRVILKYFCPLLMIFYLIHHGILPEEVEFDGDKVPSIYHKIGVAFGLCPWIFCLLCFGLITILQAPVKTAKDKLMLSIAPEYEWICLASGQLRNSRSHWLHYAYFPVGFSNGKGAPYLPQEMYQTCKGCGKAFRACCLNNCSRCGIYSTNLLFLTFPSVKPPDRSVSKPMELIESKKTPAVTVEEEDPDKKFIKDVKLFNRNEDPSKAAHGKYLTGKTKETQRARSFMSTTSISSSTKSNPNILQSGKTQDERADAIFATLTVGSLQKSMDGGRLSTNSRISTISKESNQDIQVPKTIVTETLSSHSIGGVNEQDEEFTEEDYKKYILEEEVKPEDVDGSVRITVADFDKDAI